MNNAERWKKVMDALAALDRQVSELDPPNGTLAGYVVDEMRERLIAIRPEEDQ